MKNFRSALLAAALSLVVAAGSATAAQATTKIRVGASPTPHAEILKVANDVLKPQGYELQIIEYSDYVQPNMALEGKELDANFFQHKPYLDDFNKEKGTKLVSIGTVHYEPFGIYAGKTKSLGALKDGAMVAVPNDTTNEARALLLLQSNGLIKLKDGAGLTATRRDIAENPKKLKIEEIEAAQLVRALPDVDLAVINGSAIAATTILGYSAMSGAVGGGGLGKLAIMYGYNRYQTDIMFITVVLLIVIVQVFQSFGNWATKRSDRRIS